jgi:hypothetical protein
MLGHKPHPMRESKEYIKRNLHESPWCGVTSFVLQCTDSSINVLPVSWQGLVAKLALVGGVLVL